MRVPDSHVIARGLSAASPETKKLWNQAFFDRVVVRGREVVDVRYAEPFRVISALENR